MVRDVGKGQRSKGTVKDNFNLPNKAKVFGNRYLSKETSKLKFGLNSIKDQLPEAIERIQKGPNKVRASDAKANEKDYENIMKNPGGLFEVVGHAS